MMNMHVCVCVCVRERERDRQTDRQRNRFPITDKVLSPLIPLEHQESAAMREPTYLHRPPS